MMFSATMIEASTQGLGVLPLVGDVRRCLQEYGRGRNLGRDGRARFTVLMELVLLEHAGRLRVSYRELREQLALRPGFPLEPTTPEDVDEARSLGVLVDPFDRLIVGTALRLGLPLMTSGLRPASFLWTAPVGR
jgi:hypothetical protein